MEGEQHPRRRYTRRGRSSRACGRCRDRKVRCDVVRRGTTCTNCELDEVTCVDDYNKRRRLEISSRRPSSFDTTCNRDEPDHDEHREDLRSEAFSHEGPAQDLMGKSTAVPYTEASPIEHRTARALPPLQDVDQHMGPDNRPDVETAANFPRNLYLAETPEASCPYESSSSQIRQTTRTLHGFDPLTPVSDLSSHRRSANSTGYSCSPSDLPNFLIDGRRHLSPEDREFLDFKGVWAVPPLPVLKSAIQGFIDYIYPSLPAVDIPTDLEAITTNCEPRRMSLMLLYAMMLPGIPFMDLIKIKETGCTSSWELSRTIYGRLRFLYDFNYEQDRLVTVQCLILMTYYHDQTDAQKHLRHWLTIAHRLALDICLNRDFWSAAAESEQRRRWKRLWWCLFIRDRTCAIGMRQLPLITAQDCYWSELDGSDFALPDLCQSLLQDFADSHYLHDVSVRAELASICIAQVQLWQQLDTIMQLRHQVLSPRYGNTRETTLILAPRSVSLDDPTMRRCQQKLQSWMTTHSGDLIYQFGHATPFDNRPPLLIVHTCMLNFLFHTLQCMLHRPLQEGVKSSSADYRSASFAAKSSASAILSIFEFAKAHDIVHLLPGWAVTVLMQAALTFKDFSAENTAQTCRRWQDCIEVLEMLRLRHLHAAFGIALLKSFIATREHQIEPGKSRPNAPVQCKRAELLPDWDSEGAFDGVEGAPDLNAFGDSEQAPGDLDDLGLYNTALASPWFTEFFDQNM